MMNYTLDAKGVNCSIYPCPVDYSGKDPHGNAIDFSNYYMRYNSKPYFAISGEMHFSRIEASRWEDEIIKMKMAGLTMIASYLFWIHHEEVKGRFDWEGNKNLRAFLQLCHKQGIYVILRVGPFAHGECRNGGFPDWLFGVPYDIRGNDPMYLSHVRRFFGEIGRQAEGFMFKDGGPVIGVQLENEYEHASSPWEPTTENSREWTPSGNDGPSHFAELKKLAVEAGLIVPLYSTTAWGGACAPVEHVMPLWGGYAFRPWIFYGDDIKEHPATQEFLYRDFHSNDAPDSYNFDPEYPPEDFPFICCEMGGGMSVYYRYRFQLPFRSVEAHANVKVAGGCNFLGYYMYHGGSNPKGRQVPYLNECGLPKISYDYQAAIGEFGQLRDSYHHTRLLHYFVRDFEDSFCDTKTVLPPGAEDIRPEDTETLRYCARIRGDAGYVFLNNYQDHVETKTQDGFSVTVQLDNRTVRIPQSGSISLAPDACAILPLNMNLSGVTLAYATAQLITQLQNGGETWYFFHAPDGMRPQLCFDAAAVAEVKGCGLIARDEDFLLIEYPEGETAWTSLTLQKGGTVHFCVLSREDSLRFWRVKRPEGDMAVLCGEALLDDAGSLRIESIGKETGEIAVFPRRDSITAGGTRYERVCQSEIFSYFHVTYGHDRVSLSWEDVSSAAKENDGALKRPVVGSPVTSTKIVNARAKIKITPDSFKGCKEVLVQVNYAGDIGYAFTDDQLIHDHFCNGALWEFGLKAYEREVLEKGIHLYVSPAKKGGTVNSDSAMAARFEIWEEALARIDSVRAVPIFDIPITL